MPSIFAALNVPQTAVEVLSKAGEFMGICQLRKTDSFYPGPETCVTPL